MPDTNEATLSPRPSVILIAPNVSSQMGGEAMKALQIFEQISRIEPGTLQITHARNRGELSTHPLRSKIHFVEDDRIMIGLWRSRILRSAVDWWFSRKAVQLAELLGRRLAPGETLILHQTEPNSPVVPRAISRKHLNIFGPINGNIYHPRCFRAHESHAARVRRWLHMPLQRLGRIAPIGLPRADRVLAAGGHRTVTSLRAAGVPARSITETLDCGIPDDLLNRPRIQHRGANNRFLHYGRLVFHKGTAMILRAMTLTATDTRLDIVGKGPELQGLIRLTSELGLQPRVRFLDWYKDRDELFASFSSYRSLVLPSLEDANGIVVQEAMALGLVPICLDWGGPQLLVEDGASGFLIPPTDVEGIISGIAGAMDRISLNGDLAERMSACARNQAETWRWTRVASDWVKLYREVRNQAMPHVPSAPHNKPQ